MTYRLGPDTYNQFGLEWAWESWQRKVNSHFPKPQYWSFAIRSFSVISRTLVSGGVGLQRCSRPILQPQLTRMLMCLINSSSRVLFTHLGHFYFRLEVSSQNAYSLQNSDPTTRHPSRLFQKLFYRLKRLWNSKFDMVWRWLIGRMFCFTAYQPFSGHLTPY